MVSVVLCTYNGEKYIKRQLESIIYQTASPDEIIVCDDCSKDNTVFIVKSILDKWEGKSILIRNEKNLGYRKNFEKAIKLSSGDIIYLSDQDDVWNKDKLKIMNQIFQENPLAVMAFHDAEVVNENLEVIDKSVWKESGFLPQTFKDGNYNFLLVRNPIQGAACCFKKEVFKKAYPFSNEAVHDEWLGLVAATMGEIIPLEKKLLKYRQTGYNARGANINGHKMKFIKWIKNFMNNLDNHIDYLFHRKIIWEELIERYPKEKIGDTSICDFYSFLSVRCDAIYHDSWKKLPALSKYWRIYHNIYIGYKQYIKDRLECLK